MAARGQLQICLHHLLLVLQQSGCNHLFGKKEVSSCIKLYLFAVFFLQEDYVEYSRTGSIVKGQEHTKVKSRYEEDVFISNHTVGNNY